MTLPELLFFVAAGLNVALGVAVLATNRFRRVNQMYFLFAAVVAAWHVLVWMILHVSHPVEAEYLIRAASVVAATIPTMIRALHLAIRRPGDSRSSIVMGVRWMLLANAAIGVLCMTDFFLRDVVLPQADAAGLSMAEPLYGPGFALYGLYFLAASVRLIWVLIRDLRVVQGIQRTEVGFVVLGAAAALLVGTLLGIILPILLGTSRHVPVGHAVSTVTMTAVIAYGIATRRVMEIAEVVQHFLSYVVVGGYLALVYGLVAGVVWILGFLVGQSWFIVAHVAATLAVAFSLSSAFAQVQPVITRMIRGPSALIRDRLLRDSGRSLMSVRALRGLYAEFASLVSRLVDVEDVVIFEKVDGRFMQVHPRVAEKGRDIGESDALVQLLAQSSEPLPRYSLERGRPAPDRTAALRAMEARSVHLAAPVLGSNRMEAMVLLGSRTAGLLYGRQEVDIVRTLCGQLAFSLVNARLYTAVEEARLYNEILLENLSSGVVACDADRKITLLNREAVRILGVPAAQLAGRGIDALPPGLAEPLEQTLTAGRGVHDADLVLSDGEVRHLRLSSSVITGLEGRRLGALLVLNDTTMLRRLEDRMRRADRLASVGTLAAGMAHEIKNPLVSIKTFVQVLPRAFDDPEVRSTFCPLIESEVSRIDTVVNHLLNFARPAKASLQPMQLHAVLVHTLRLVEPRLRSKGLTLETAFDAPTDRIEGDASLLEQVFINLYFNAVDAMSSGGRLRVETSVAQVETGDRDLWGAPVRVRRLRVTVRDTGHGIRSEDLARVFDPFFTTKSEGSGLGLAIAYGIIQEHRGSFDVESRVGEGTAFHIAFPLAEPAAPGGIL